MKIYDILWKPLKTFESQFFERIILQQILVGHALSCSVYMIGLVCYWLRVSSVESA